MLVETNVLSLADRLRASPAHMRFAEHPFFAEAHTAELTREQVEVFLGQWWHPLHYFPTFLARCVAVLPDIESKSAITRILDQEVGHGRAHWAHERIYVDSMERVGFGPAEVTESPALPETAALVAGYQEASAERFAALGSVFATEVTDLLMVSSIGVAVQRVTGKSENAWVAIHVAQEPEHVEQSTQTMVEGFTVAQEDQVLAAADRMWGLWTGFFDRLTAQTGVGR